EHRTVRADLVIADRLEELVKGDGRALYEPFEREAARLLEKGRAEKDPRALEEVARIYPVARVVPASLLALGQLSEELNRRADAARAYKHLLVLAASDAERARALWGLGRSYEAQRLWVPARETYVRILGQYPDIRLDELGPDARLGTLVEERL